MCKELLSAAENFCTIPYLYGTRARLITYRRVVTPKPKRKAPTNIAQYTPLAHRPVVLGLRATLYTSVSELRTYCTRLNAKAVAGCKWAPDRNVHFSREP